MSDGLPKFLSDIDAARRAGAHGVVLQRNTSDRVLAHGRALHTKYAIANHFINSGYHVGELAIGTGFRPLNPPGTSPNGRSPFQGMPEHATLATVLPVLGRALRGQERVVVLVDFGEHCVPSQGGGSSAFLREEQMAALETFTEWGRSDDVRATENMVILIAYDGSGVHPLLVNAGGYRVIDVDLPSEAERAAFARFLADARDRNGLKHIGRLDASLSEHDFARVTKGLPLRDIEALFLESGASGEAVSRTTAVAAKRRHMKSLEERGLLEVQELEEGFCAMAGAEHAKAAFRAVVEAFRAGDAALPRGFLLAGPPGSGKSEIAPRAAAEIGVPYIGMKNVMGQFVGQSESQLEEFFWFLRQMWPAVVGVDEVDQKLGVRQTGQSGDSGTSARVLAGFMTRTGGSEFKGKVLFVAMTNRPDCIDDAIRDRFPVVIPMIHPSPSEVEVLLPVLAKQINRTLEPDVDVRAALTVPKMQIVTVRALQELMVQAARRADVASGKIGTPIGMSPLEEAVREFQPTFNRVEHEYQALLALSMASMTTHLPWMGVDGPRIGDWPSYVDAVVDRRTGLLDPPSLSGRLHELEMLRGHAQARRAGA